MAGWRPQEWKFCALRNVELQLCVFLRFSTNRCSKHAQLSSSVSATVWSATNILSALHSSQLWKFQLANQLIFEIILHFTSETSFNPFFLCKKQKKKLRARLLLKVDYKHPVCLKHITWQSRNQEASLIAAFAFEA